MKFLVKKKIDTSSLNITSLMTKLVLPNNNLINLRREYEEIKKKNSSQIIAIIPLWSLARWP